MAYDYTQNVGNVTAAQQTVNPNDLVSHNLTGLLSADNPYITQARAQAAQQAASRGMLNSTMAAGQGEVAARQAALPIAQGDAAEYAQVDAANQAAENTLKGQKIGYAGQMGSAAIGASAQRDIAHLNVEAQLKMQADQLAQQQGQFNVGEENWKQQFGLTQDQFTFQKDTWQKTFDQTQHNWETGLDFQNYWNNRNLANQASTNVLGFQSGIFQNPNMTPEQRQAALNSGNALTQAYIQSLQGFQNWVPPWNPVGSNNSGAGTNQLAPPPSGGTPQPHP